MDDLLQQRYDAIKAHGYIIDVRMPLPILIHGVTGWQLRTWLEALEFAESRLHALQQH